MGTASFSKHRTKRVSADQVNAFQVDDFNSGFWKSDTGAAYGLDSPHGNRARLDELLAHDPQLMHTRDGRTLYHSNRSDPASYFVTQDCPKPNIVYYVPYRSLSTPIGIAVEVASWQMLVGLGTAFKDRVFFDLLPTTFGTIVSSANLPRGGVRFWIDTLYHAHKQGFPVGVLDGSEEVWLSDACPTFEHWRRATIGFGDDPPGRGIRFFFSR